MDSGDDHFISSCSQSERHLCLFGESLLMKLHLECHHYWAGRAVKMAPDVTEKDTSPVEATFRRPASARE